MADVASVINEIQALSKFHGKGKSMVLLEGLSKSAGAKIAQIPHFDTCVALRLGDVITDAKLPNNLESILTEACDQRMQVFDGIVGQT